MRRTIPIVCYETQGKLLEIRESLRKRRVSVVTVGLTPPGIPIAAFIITLDPGVVPTIAAIAGA